MPTKDTDADGIKIDTFVSIVAVLNKYSPNVDDFIGELHAYVSRTYANYELVLVDNGVDGSQLTRLRDLLMVLPCVRALRLSRHFSFDTAVFAGLEAAIGDCVVVVVPGIDPVDAIQDVVDSILAGNDIVQGLSSVSMGGSGLGKLGRSAFYWYNRRFLDVYIPVNATYFTGLTRRAVNSLTNTSRRFRYLRHLVRQIGYRLMEFEYTPLPGPARERTLRAGYSEAVEMISSYSLHPLRAITITGVIAGLVNLFYAGYVVVINLVSKNVAEGWTTTSLQLSLMFFVICAILAIQSEYIGRILTESRREPQYFVMEEIESQTLISDEQRRNVSN